MSHDDNDTNEDCGYCKGNRHYDDIETGKTDLLEEKCTNSSVGFSSTKMRVDDFESCLNAGFTRCGTYFYRRASYKSCCEVWQYRVEINKFKMSKSQKSTIRKLHKYLNYGNIHGE